MLNSFFRDRSTAAEQTARVRSHIGAWQPRRGNLLMVTHQVNITELTGVYPASGEAVVLAPRADGAHEVVGRIEIE